MKEAASLLLAPTHTPFALVIPFPITTATITITLTTTAASAIVVPDIAINITSNNNNDSFVFPPEEVQSVSERARIVLSQPVAIVSLTLCLLSLLANALSITATLLGPNGLVTHLKLVVSLGISDMLLSISTLSHLLNRIFNPVPSFTTPPEDRLAFACVSTFHFALKTMAIVISLLNLLVMAMDHYVAIMNPLHYPTRLSRTKGTLIICVIWFIAFIGGCSVFAADLPKFRKVSFFMNYCEYVQISDYQGEYLVFAVAFLSLFVITYAYGRIYLEVRRTYSNGSNNRMEYARNRKALLTTLLIIGTFVFCWLPTCLYQIAMLIQLRVDAEKVQRMFATFLLVNRYLNALLLLNSLCDPIIYAFRLRDVQLGYRKLFQKCFSRRHRRLSSFRSSMMRQTQIAHLPPVDVGRQSSSAGQSSPPCNSLSMCFEVGPEADLAEVTPMIVCASQHVHQRNGNVVCLYHSGGVGGGRGQGMKRVVTSEDDVRGKLANVLCGSCDCKGTVALGNSGTGEQWHWGTAAQGTAAQGTVALGNSGTGNSGTGNSGTGEQRHREQWHWGTAAQGTVALGNSGTGNSGTGKQRGTAALGNSGTGEQRHWGTVALGNSGTGNSGTGNSGTGEQRHREQWHWGTAALGNSGTGEQQGTAALGNSGEQRGTVALGNSGEQRHWGTVALGNSREYRHWGTAGNSGTGEQWHWGTAGNNGTGEQRHREQRHWERV
ncbi:hypothetical protein ACOMHN_058992 [Nucella lapillus]